MSINTILKIESKLSVLEKNIHALRKEQTKLKEKEIMNRWLNIKNNGKNPYREKMTTVQMIEYIKLSGLNIATKNNYYDKFIFFDGHIPKEMEEDYMVAVNNNPCLHHAESLKELKDEKSLYLSERDGMSYYFDGITFKYNEINKHFDELKIGEKL